MSDDPLALIVIALASWRIAYLLTNEAGPANVFGRFRDLFADPTDMEIKPGSLMQLTTCVYCMSFWTTAAVALLWAVDVKGGREALFFVAAWAAATALDMVARRDA